VSIKVNCPRCGKTFEPPAEAGKASCPHCGAANTDAVTVLGVSEAMAAGPPGTQTTTVTCPRCRKPFAAPVAEGRTWLSCPHCNEVNVEALVNDAPEAGKDQRTLGVLLEVVGILGLTVGTCLSGLGMAVRHIDGPTDFGDIAIPVTCGAGSLCLITAGVKLASGKWRAEAGTRTYGGLSIVALVLVLSGFSAWLVAFTVCTAASSGLIR